MCYAAKQNTRGELMDWYDSIPAEMNYAQMGNWESKAHPNAGVGPLVNHFIEECKPFKLNWAKLYILCGLRSQWFRAPWAKEMDHFHLGKKAQTFRESARLGILWVKDGAKGLTPEEIEQVASEYAQACSYAKGENPGAEEPIVTPPKPPEPSKPPTDEWWVCSHCGTRNPGSLTTCSRCYVPREGTEPDWWDCEKCDERGNPPLLETCGKCGAPRPGSTPKEPEKPGQPTDWKKVTKWVGAIASFLLTIGFAIKFIPGAAAIWVFIEPILRFLEKLFN
jgi:ribosomal protein L40E